MMSKTDRVIKIVEELNDVFEIRVFLDHDPYKVLVRTILSQRTRDENTDQATNNLFAKYKDIYEVVEAPTEDVQELIKPAGFYRVKAGRIQEVSQILIDEYGGEVPDTLEELVKLPGVGRKTANCVLVFAFELSAIPVDGKANNRSNRSGRIRGMNVRCNGIIFSRAFQLRIQLAAEGALSAIGQGGEGLPAG